MTARSFLADSVKPASSRPSSHPFKRRPSMLRKQQAECCSPPRRELLYSPQREHRTLAWQPAALAISGLKNESAVLNVVASQTRKSNWPQSDARSVNGEYATSVGRNEPP